MKHPRPWLTCLLALTGATVGLRAADWKGLLDNSPFAAAAGTAATANANNQELEFRGVVQEGGRILVNLFNPASKTSQWIAVGTQEGEITVSRYDAANGEVQLQRAGRDLRLPLKQARVALVQAPVQPVATAPAEPGERPEPNDGNPRRAEWMRARREGGEPPEGFRNLPPDVQQMIQEVRRRRAERAGRFEDANAPRPAPPPAGNSQ